MASRLQDVIARGLASARPLPTAVAIGTLYYSSDTQITERNSGTSWESYSDSASGGVPGAHAATHAAAGSDPVTLDQSQIINLTTDLAGKVGTLDPRLTDARVPLAHAISHASAGSDPVNVTALAGYPGGTTNFLRADATFSPLPAPPVRVASIEMMIDGGISPILTGLKGFLEVPFACTIQAVTLLADVSGSIVVDIWKDTFANYPPTVADTITAAAKPTITAALKSQNTVLTGWTTAIAAGDILGFNVDSVSTIKKLTLSLKVQVI